MVKLPRPSVPRLRPRCSVRACERELVRSERAWSCGAGHAFDVARSGYVNLLQPSDRRSSRPGDARAAVEARFRLEERGIGDVQAAALVGFVGGLLPQAGAAVLDVGAGTGGQLARLQEEHGVEGWAVDLSSLACELGGRKRPELNWVVANADRRLPFFDGAFALLLSSVGPKNPAEFRRLLAPDGALVLVLSAADDLIELRAAVQGEGTLIDRVTPALERFEPWFTCLDRTSVRTRVRLLRPELEDVLASTYRGTRLRERERLATLEALDVTFAAELLHLAPRPAVTTS